MIDPLEMRYKFENTLTLSDDTGLFLIFIVSWEKHNAVKCIEYDPIFINKTKYTKWEQNKKKFNPSKHVYNWVSKEKA